MSSWVTQIRPFVLGLQGQNFELWNISLTKSTMLCIVQQFSKGLQLPSRIHSGHWTASERKAKDIREWYQDTNPWVISQRAKGIYNDRAGDWVFRVLHWDSWINARIRAVMDPRRLFKISRWGLPYQRKPWSASKWVRSSTASLQGAREGLNWTSACWNGSSEAASISVSKSCSS